MWLEICSSTCVYNKNALDSNFRSEFFLSSQVKVMYGYMFMNRISMSQTCLMTFPTKKIFTTTSRYRGHSALVRHNTNFATVHSRVTVGSCSVEYEYKLLRQFTTTVEEARCYL